MSKFLVGGGPEGTPFLLSGRCRITRGEVTRNVRWWLSGNGNHSGRRLLFFLLGQPPGFDEFPVDVDGVV